MDFPSTRVTSRKFTHGDWPIKTYKSVSGSEVRLMRGSRPSGMTLELSYENIADINAELFLQHYDSRLGTFHSFQLPPGAPARTAGWTGPTNWQRVQQNFNAWRYAEPPSVTASGYPGRSNVSVRLVAVL
jgi:hypothetical protein